MSVLSDSFSQDLLTINRRYCSFKQVIWYCTNDKKSAGKEGKAKQIIYIKKIIHIIFCFNRF